MNQQDGDWFDEVEATRAVDFIERFCSHVKGHSGPFILEGWQKNDIIRPLFGWKNKDGLRKYRTCYIEIPRKNGKSNLSAAIALYLLFGSGEKGGEIISAAGDRNQARIVFDIAAQMVRQNKSLSNHATVHKSEIHFKESFYKSISAEARTKHGFNCSGIIFDELHTQPNRELWDVLTTSVASRAQPLIVALTTAGHDTSSICYEVHEYALKVRDGSIDDPTFLPVIYAADQGDDWSLEETWRKANPGFGSICKSSYFEQEVRKAKANPSHINTFKRLHLNIWTASKDSWISDAEFMQGALPLPDDSYLKGLTCYGGLDLAATRDLTSFALVFVDGDRYYLKVHSFLNEETATSARSTDHVDYLQFAAEGDITITPGNVTDYSFVKAHILEQCTIYQPKCIAFDRKFSPYIVPELEDEGIEMSPFGQGYYEMSYPTKEMEKAIVSGKVIHGGNRCLRWQMSCVKIDRDPADNIKVTKNRGKQGQQVDGVVAAIMAFGEMLKDTSDEMTLEIITL